MVKVSKQVYYFLVAAVTFELEEILRERVAKWFLEFICQCSESFGHESLDEGESSYWCTHADESVRD